MGRPAVAPAKVRRIILSASHQRLLTEAAAFLQESAADAGALVLAATRGAAEDFIRGCCRERNGLLGVHIMTPLEAASVLATELAVQRKLASLSGLAMTALAARAVFECRRDGGLAYFEPVADTPGFPRALASLLGELRLEGVDRKQLAKAGPAGPDLARLLGSYEKELAERSLADRAAVSRLAAEAAPRSQHRLIGLPLILLDCSLDSACERELAAALARRSTAVFSAVVVGDRSGAGHLEKILNVKAENVDAGPSERSLDRVRRHVFSLEVPPPRELDGSVEFFSAPGEGMECVEIARRIRLLADKGLTFDRAAILLRSPENYQPLVEEALRRAGIPAYFTRGTTRPDPAGRAFLALLACAAERLSAARFAEYLSLGQVPGLDESGAPPKPRAEWTPPEEEEIPVLKTAPDDGKTPGLELDESDQSPVIAGTLRVPFAWEKLLVDAAVIGGRDRWSRRLRGLEQELRLQFAELKEPDDPRRAHLERQIERLGNLERFALPVIGRLDALPSNAAWGEWLERLRELAAMTLRHPQSVLSALGELQAMDAVGPVGLEEVRGALADRLSFLRVEPPGRRYGRVFVGTIGEVRGRSFEAVFLPGLAESSFPRKVLEDPLLLDEHRKKLEAPLRLRDDRLERERLLLRLAAGAAREQLVVSYPRMDVAQTRSRVPSFYFWEVVRAAEGRLPDLRELERRAARAAPTRLGWPAPKDPQEAIDDAEYDLAVLDPLLHKPRGEPASRGQARYLVESNELLARSLRARWRRWDSSSWSGADGIVEPCAGARAALAAHRVSARSYSPTALETFACCPYRFLLHAIHRLRPREQAAPLEQLDPLTRGALFHAAQFEVFRALQGAGFLPVDAANLEGALALAEGALDQVAAEHEEKLAPAIPRVWQSEMEKVRADLRGWVRQLLAVHTEWLPAHFEFAFGLTDRPRRDPKSTADEALILNGVRLRGSIDLVEKHRRTERLRVTDHKTGKAPTDMPLLVAGVAQSPQVVNGGRTLQPVLYALAAEKLLGQPVESGMLFYCTQLGSYRNFQIPLDDETRQAAAQVLATIDRAVEQGFLPAAPREQACAYCDYSLVCGPYEEMRLRRKQRARLAELETLRQMP